MNRLTTIINSYANPLATLLLILMFGLLFSVARQDTLTIDEKPHIAAAITYVTQQDFRLNPEHPPLLKILSGLAIKGLVNPKVPINSPAWQDQEWGQWRFGDSLLWQSGNNPERIIRAARLPAILLTVLLGWLIYYWTKKEFNNRTALIALTLYSFSPTILAHGHLVTFDISAALGFFISLISFLYFLKRPTWQSSLVAGLLLGLGLLTKFSVVIMLPINLVLLGLWIWIRPANPSNSSPRQLFFQSVMIFIIALAVVGAMYNLLIVHYPAAKQVDDTQFLLRYFTPHYLTQPVDWLAKQPFSRALAHYLLGLYLTFNRASFANTGYWLGWLTKQGSHWYFPLLYLLKEPIGTHWLGLIAIGGGLASLKFNKIGSIFNRSSINLNLIALALVTIIYWSMAIASPLNIGIRHIIPTLPLLFILIAHGVDRYLDISKYPLRKTIVALGLLLTILASLFSYPHYLAYYNELAGGTGYKISVDSNYDWGQDLTRLADYVQKNQIDHLALDYYGSADPAYYLGTRYESWISSQGPPQGWLAISMSRLVAAQAKIAPSVTLNPEDRYTWLRPYKPVATIGRTILLYHLPQ